MPESDGKGAAPCQFQKPDRPEFRREVVELYRRSGRTLKEIASDIGVSRESLRLWVRQAVL